MADQDTNNSDYEEIRQKVSSLQGDVVDTVRTRSQEALRKEYGFMKEASTDDCHFRNTKPMDRGCKLAAYMNCPAEKSQNQNHPQSHDSCPGTNRWNCIDNACHFSLCDKCFTAYAIAIVGYKFAKRLEAGKRCLNAVFEFRNQHESAGHGADTLFYADPNLSRRDSGGSCESDELSDLIGFLREKEQEKQKRALNCYMPGKRMHLFSPEFREPPSVE